MPVEIHTCMQYLSMTYSLGTHSVLHLRSLLEFFFKFLGWLQDNPQIQLSRANNFIRCFLKVKTILVFQFSVLFFVCFVCFRSLCLVLNVVCDSGLSILDCAKDFPKVYLSFSNDQRVCLECGISWVRAPIGSNQRL